MSELKIEVICKEKNNKLLVFFDTNISKEVVLSFITKLTGQNQLAFKCILSDKVKNDSFKIVESLPNQPKTKDFVSFLKKNNLEGKKLTIVSSAIDDNLSLASRNVPYVSLVKASSCSVRDLFDNDLILIDVSGLEDLSNRFGGKN